MTNIRFVKLLSILGLLLINFSSCLNNKVTAMPNREGLLDNNPCSVPCFQNITPGITTKNEVLNIFNDLGYTKNCIYFDNLSEGGSRSYFCNNIGISLSNMDIVLAVSYSPQPPEFISLEKIIEEFGPPDCYVAVGSETEIYGSYNIYLFFDSVPLIVYFPEGKKPTYELSKNTIIESLVFFEKEHYLESKFSCQQWKGYGDY